MAKIKWGMIVTDGSGKLGGHVFSKNRGGSYIRTKVTPTNPQTTFQTAVRSIFAALSSKWSALTDANRKSYRDKVSLYSRTNVFGDLKNPSGKALHQRLNQNLVLTGQAQLDNCPDPSDVPYAGLSAVAGSEAGGTMTITTNEDTTGSKIMVFATGSLSAGTNFVKNKLRKIGVVDGGAGATASIQALYDARFTAPLENANLFVGVKIINANGQASPIEVVRAVIGA